MDAFVCLRCAAVNPTCCRMDPTCAHLCFPLSAPEKDRLSPHARAMGLPAAAVEKTSEEFLQAMRSLIPDRKRRINTLFPIPGEHLRLPTAPDGACLFLSEEGCRLPGSARPWYCQLFPMWIRRERLDMFLPGDCLVAREARSLKNSLELLAMTREEVRNLYAALCRDWGLTPEEA